jgi:small basic protein (TIGR04137 family)
MSLDPSLRTSGGLSQHRNVLTRAERIAKLTEQGRFDKDKNRPTGLVKVGNRKVGGGKKVEKKEGDEAAAPAAGGAKAAAAPAAKAAAPAAKKK